MVSIWNYDRLGRNIFLGEVLTQMATIVDQGTFQQHTSEWYELEEMVRSHFQPSFSRYHYLMIVDCFYV